jgi:hypothetical protein
MSNELAKIAPTLAAGAAGAWLVISSQGTATDYGQLTLGLLGLWLSAVWLKQYVEQARGSVNGWLGWAINTALAVIPGAILLWYSLFTPAEPSLTNSGVDVCEFQVGWCISGNRALSVLGGMLLLAGVGWSYFTFTIEQRTKGR